MGAVFEVVHVETQRRRALKVMLPELLANRQLRERFQMEARITANVESEYIVDVFDAGIDAATGMPFLVMELLNGEDLAKVLERTGPIPVPQVLEYLRQVGSALDKTHAAGIVRTARRASKSSILASPRFFTMQPRARARPKASGLRSTWRRSRCSPNPSRQRPTSMLWP